jgi:hypothetical protein
LLELLFGHGLDEELLLRSGRRRQQAGGRYQERGHTGNGLHHLEISSDRRPAAASHGAVSGSFYYCSPVRNRRNG